MTHHIQAPGQLTVGMPRRLDGNTTPALERSLDLALVRDLTLDFSDCQFVSSAGIRMVLKAFQHLSRNDGHMRVTNVGEDVHRIFDLSGLVQIIAVERKRREIVLDGAEPLSAGVCGECFRLDEESIVKLYREGVDATIAEREKQYARAAFVMGIPTAISYDVVSCGDRTGVIFEMLHARLFSEIIREDPAALDQHARTLTEVLATLHTATGDPAILPDMKERFRGYLDEIAEFLGDDENEYLLDRLNAIPDAETCVHFDLHSSNLMIRDGEPIIIDMGDLSIGHYLFDVGLMFTIYGIPELGLSERATRIPVDVGLALWESFERQFFADKSAEEYAFFDENRYFLGALRVIYTITFLPSLRDEFIAALKDLLLPRMMGARGTVDREGGTIEATIHHNPTRPEQS